MPIPPTNLTPETAYDITGLLPFNDTIDLSSVPNQQKNWFKYTLSGQFGISTWVESIKSPFLYRPTIRYYFGIPAAPTDDLQSGSESAVEFQIEESVGIAKVGTIYILIENGYIGVGYVPNQPLTIRFELIPNTSIPAGSLLISNDIQGYPASLIHLNGTPSQLRSFTPVGESAAILENGLSLWSDRYPDHDHLFLYDANLVIITDLTWSFRDQLRAPISSNRIDTFYVEGSGKITTVSTTGTVGSTVWTVPTASNIYFINPSTVDNDIIYVKTSDGISKFHKSTQILDSAYLPYNIISPHYAMAGYYGEEFLVLPSDNILAMYSPYTDNPDHRGKVILHGPTGTVIREYFGDFESPNRIAYGVDYTTFWLWTYNDDFESQFIQFRVSDGVRLNEFTLDTTSGGNGFGTEGEPDNLFGVPESCPFIITTTPLPPYGEDTPPPEPPTSAYGGIYYINPAKAHDTYYAIEKKIPDPTVKTALIGE